MCHCTILHSTCRRRLYTYTNVSLHSYSCVIALILMCHCTILHSTRRGCLYTYTYLSFHSYSCVIPHILMCHFTILHSTCRERLRSTCAVADSSGPWVLTARSWARLAALEALAIKLHIWHAWMIHMWVVHMWHDSFVCDGCGCWRRKLLLFYCIYVTYGWVIRQYIYT